MNHDDNRYTHYQNGAQIGDDCEVMLTSTAELFGHNPQASGAAVARDHAITLRRMMENECVAMPVVADLTVRRSFLFETPINPEAFINARRTTTSGS